MFRHGSGFAFEFRLAAGQNGHHLLRSARAQKKAKERMIAVASADEAVNPDAKVRCVLVDAETLRLAEDDPRYAVVLSADKPKDGQRRVFRRKNREVPEDALWLVHPTQPGREPTKEWGQSSEELTCADIGPTAGWSDDLREARRQARRRRRKTIAVHAAVWGYWFAWSVYLGRTSPDGSLDEQIWGSVAGALFLLAVTVGGIVGVGAVRESLRTAHWFGGGNGPKQAWTGGTLTASELGLRLNSRGDISWKLWRQYARYAGRTASGEPALLKDLSEKHLGPARRPLQDAVDLAGNGENSGRDFLSLLAEADMCIPGPGLHNSSWAGAEWDTSAELAKYREILEPLRYPEYLRQVHRLQGNRQQVVKAARSYLRACVNHLAGRPPNPRRTLSASLRARAVKRSFDEELRLDAVAFAHHIDKIGDNDRTGVAEALYTYLLARWFGFKALEAAGSAHRLEEALKEAARTCPVGQPLP